MRAYGYKKKCKHLMTLSETTLECSFEELEQLIYFLNNFKSKVKNSLQDNVWKNDKNVIIHDHFQTDNDTNFIIAMRLNSDK